MEAVAKPQAQLLLLGIALGCIGIVVAISSQPIVQVQGLKTGPSTVNVVVPTTGSEQQIKVLSPTSLPAATSEYLQGSSSLQQQDSDVGTPSNGASQLLQPNSGRSSFSDQDSVQ